MLRRLIILNVILLLSYWASAQYRPKYVAFVGGQKSGEVVTGSFKAQQGVGAEFFVAGNHWESLQVDSFRMTAFRNNELLFTHQNIGNKFDSTLQLRIKNLKVSDKVLVYDIWATTAEQSKVFLQPLEYLLK
jgi:hypothetical protein